MNRDQAAELLWALGSPTSEDRQAAIGIVLDLLQESAEQSADERAVTQSRWVVDDPGAAVSGATLAEQKREFEHENEILTVAVESWAALWRRIQAAARVDDDSLGSTEATIDRIAFLAELERTRPTQHRVDELQMELHRVEVQRDDLLTAARKFVEADDSVRGRYALVLADVVAKINAREDT